MDVQQANASLTSLSGLTLAADKGLYATAADTLALFDILEGGRAFLGGTADDTQRATLNIGTSAVKNFTDDADLTVDPENLAKRGDVAAAVAASNNVATGEYTATTTISTAIPLDATVPQVSEGTEILSVSITPASATSKVRLAVSVGNFITSGSTVLVVFALFRDGAADAIYSVAKLSPSGGASEGGVMINLVDSPATASAVTYTIRVGVSSGTLSFNSLFGSAGFTQLIAQEIAA